MSRRTRLLVAGMALFASVAAGLFAASPAEAHHFGRRGFGFGFGFGYPVFYAPPVYPVYVAPPVVYAPPPVPYGYSYGYRYRVVHYYRRRIVHHYRRRIVHHHLCGCG